MGGDLSGEQGSQAGNAKRKTQHAKRHAQNVRREVVAGKWVDFVDIVSNPL
jgi:hypothetical protein